MATIPRFTPVTLADEYFVKRRVLKLQEFHPDTKWVCYEDIEKDYAIRVAPDYAPNRFDSILVPRSMVTPIEAEATEGADVEA
jgi:hypothetical protein